MSKGWQDTILAAWQTQEKTIAHQFGTGIGYYPYGSCNTGKNRRKPLEQCLGL